MKTRMSGGLGRYSCGNRRNGLTSFWDAGMLEPTTTFRVSSYLPVPQSVQDEDQQTLSTKTRKISDSAGRGT